MRSRLEPILAVRRKIEMAAEKPMQNWRRSQPKIWRCWGWGPWYNPGMGKRVCEVASGVGAVGSTRIDPLRMGWPQRNIGPQIKGCPRKIGLPQIKKWSPELGWLTQSKSGLSHSKNGKAQSKKTDNDFHGSPFSKPNWLDKICTPNVCWTKWYKIKWAGPSERSECAGKYRTGMHGHAGWPVGPPIPSISIFTSFAHSPTLGHHGAQRTAMIGAMAKQGGWLNKRVLR